MLIKTWMGVMGLNITTRAKWTKGASFHKQGLSRQSMTKFSFSSEEDATEGQPDWALPLVQRGMGTTEGVFPKTHYAMTPTPWKGDLGLTIFSLSMLYDFKMDSTPEDPLQ